MHHENNFDFLRFAAAVMVWYSHCYALTGGRDWLSDTIYFESFGGLGVTIFFIISGYFITASYERQNSLFGFLRNRLLRVMPALILVVLVSVFVLGPLVTTLPVDDYFAHKQTWRYLRTLLVFPLQYDLPGVFQNNVQHAVNGSLWTLQHELRCYFVIAALGALGILQWRIMLGLFLTGLAILLYGAYCGDNPPKTLFGVRWMKLYFAVHLGFLFCGGALVYMFRQHIPRHPGFLTAAVLLVILSTRKDIFFGPVLFDFAMIYSVIYLGFLRVPVLMGFARFGDFSYGFYLWAFPMQQLALHFMRGLKGPDFAFMAISFTATLACAVASWHLIEKKALSYKA